MEMKKTFRWMMGATALAVAVAVTSCSDDDDPQPDPDNGFVVNRDDLKGEITSGEVVLEEGTYKLTGALVVKENAKLVIKPGVIVEATALPANQFAAVRYIGISRGAQIDVQGTAANPVVFTAAEKKPGAWGGLVLCGAAPINKGETAQSEVGDLAYGGTNASDNSGSIKYLRIEYSGYSYNDEKEFNGVSFFGVGSATVIENIQVHEGSDDGFEWFGGTVNAKNLVVTNYSTEFVGDDLFDWTEGWTGSGENWYGIRTNDGNRGIEADNNSNNHLATPVSNPTIKNLTLIGNGAGGENHAIKLRVGTKGMFDNVVLSNWGTGFDVEHDEGILFVGDGSLKATGVKFDNVTKLSTGKNTAGTSVDISALFTENTNATGAGAGTAKPEWAGGWTVGLD
ncbi:hypothetical protein SAMN05444682_11170 [Parapedobacter indicus]|uniref:Right handed beta helix region n=2 Tax=Parapedobacter indicus TaxID=1477437 RepID=A0A1I3SMC3_9SPHI|nr:hypothetical protein CLV26_111129 [Parapedobacter indicus]SFJ58537.1 hypothetical protein SAMN05444682_11170 [Parapedobacter indicus]